MHFTPWDEQAPAHAPPEQARVPQHCADDWHEPPLSTHPLIPVHVPWSQVKVPQQSLLLEHDVPAPWQRPSEQTLFVLQVRVPQQSPLVLQVLLEVWQGPVWGPPGTLLRSTPELHAVSAMTAPSKAGKRRSRGGITTV